jgi:hypothetical protein
MGNSDVIIEGVWSYTPIIVPDYTVSYVWSGNIPSGVTLPVDYNSYVTNQPYSVDIEAEWMIYAIAESGDRVVLSVDENRGSEPRMAEVVITAGDLSHTIIVEQGVKPETMKLAIGHTASTLDSPTWGGSDIRGTIDWGDGTTEEYQDGISHDYVDNQRRSAQFTMEGATTFCIERVGEIESITISL